MLRRFQVTRAGVFGSTARDEDTQGSGVNVSASEFMQ